MIPRNSKNERLKREYADFLKHADGKAEQTIRQIEKSIQRYETFTGHADFGAFDQQKAKGFKADLANRELAKATILSTVTALKRFFGWLAKQPGYKSKIQLTDIDYLSLSEKDIHAAKAPADRAIPTVEQVLHVVETMPAETAIDKRNRALVAFIAITGIRDGAVVTLKVKHFDMARRLVLQNPSEVKTKFGKRIDTFLFPLDDRLEEIVIDWINYLRSLELSAETGPLFPKSLVIQDEDNCFKPQGLSREHWANASPVRTIFRDAFACAGLAVHTPHSMRHMIISEAYRRDLSPRELIAWSQNLGHEGLLTTITSYGKIPLQEQGRLIRGARRHGSEADLLAKIRDLVSPAGNEVFDPLS